MKVLVINCGSSSLKYQLIDMSTEESLAQGLVERIGIEGSVLTQKVEGKDKYIVNEKSKSKLLAIFLALFLGTMGIHRFYLGYIKIGIVQFILWVLGFFTGGITWIITEVWSFIEFILIFINKIKDSNGNELE